MKFKINDVVEDKKWAHKLMIKEIDPRGYNGYYKAQPIFVDGEWLKEELECAYYREYVLEKTYDIDKQYLRKQKLKKLEL
jgi:hypothetical protein